MVVALGRLVFWTVLAATPLAIWLFRARQWGFGFVWHLRRIIVDYRWHLVLFFLIIVEKNWVDSLNDPLRGVFGDKTGLLAAIEGDLTARLQASLEHPLLSQVLSIHYLWMYVFMNYFTVILWAYRDDRELANQAALTYSIIYILAIPFYIFFNVQVTSDYWPGMKSLLYHGGPSFYDFFVRVDPLDNAFPSLHTAIPVGLVLVTWWTMRRRGYTIRDWEHRGYLWFLIANTVLFLFSILYLGIHWIIDIPGGIFVGLLGAAIADDLRYDVFRAMAAIERRLLGLLRPLTDRVAPPARRLRERARRWAYRTR